MADLITGPATDILKTLSSLAYTEFLELYHLKDGIEELKSTLPKIEELLNLLEENQLKYWLELAESARYDVEDLISSWEAEYHLWEIKPQVRKLVTPFATSNLLSKHRISAELKRITETLDKIISEGRENTRITQASSLNNGSQSRNKRETGSQLPFIMVGRGDEKNKMIDLLKDETSTSTGGNFSVIPILGSGGVGKTFLAQLVYNHFNETQEHFNVRTWVWVTEDFDINKIFMTIVLTDIEEQKKRGNINPDVFALNSATVDFLKDRVKKILNGNKFLIVLDDLWEYNHLDMHSLVDVLSVGAMGSKVLVTSRSTEVSSLKYSESPNLLQCLDEDQSWSLFEQFAFKDSKRAPELVKHGREIVSRCRGLPLAIKTIGALLCGKEVSKWSKIVQSSIWEERDVQVLPALRLSYNNLPTRAHRKCFAYCALFPKSYLFEKDEMVKLWMAEGYVQLEPGQKPEDIGAEYFDVLSQRTLLQSSLQDGGKHTMHDLIHDLAQTVSQPFCCRVEKLEMNKKSSFNPNEITRHISLLAEQVEQPTLQIIKNSKRLHTLLFPVPRHRAYGTSELLLPFEDLGRFGNAQRQVFQSLVYMHVLDMSYSAVQTLPESIGEMKLLRYLDFSKTELKELPDSICNLYHLQTLKLLGCPFIFSLPKNFQNLVNLRHLELDDMFWFKVRAIPQSIGRLTNLHNLHKFQVGCNTGYKLEELKDMEHLTGKLHILNLEHAVNAGKAKKREGKQIQHR
ncbi:hypothetical protein ACLB2K_066583 [Fragaria x ananassa]